MEIKCVSKCSVQWALDWAHSLVFTRLSLSRKSWIHAHILFKSDPTAACPPFNLRKTKSQNTFTSEKNDKNPETISRGGNSLKFFSVAEDYIYTYIYLISNSVPLRSPVMKRTRGTHPHQKAVWDGCKLAVLQDTEWLPNDSSSQLF